MKGAAREETRGKERKGEVVRNLARKCIKIEVIVMEEETNFLFQGPLVLIICKLSQEYLLQCLSSLSFFSCGEGTLKGLQRERTCERLLRCPNMILTWRRKRKQQK